MTMPESRRLIPLYDDTAAIACTIDQADTADRVVLVERMRANLVRLDRTEHGLLLHLEPSAENEADVRRFAVDEKACCTFWGFEVLTANGLALRWDAPPSAAGLIAKLAVFFEGDMPLTELSGLL